MSANANIPTEKPAPFKFQKWGANPTKIPFWSSTSSSKLANQREATAWKKQKKAQRILSRVNTARSVELPCTRLPQNQKQGAVRTIKADILDRLGGFLSNLESQMGSLTLHRMIGSTALSLYEPLPAEKLSPPSSPS